MTNMIFNTEDFNKKLLEALCEEDEDESNICLISGEKIMDDHIALICKHKFNYKSIFFEIENQKEDSKLEICRLKRYQIKCPYCRNIQNGVISFNDKYPELKKDGINWPPRQMAKNNLCDMILKSGKRKGEICGKQCILKKCKTHCNMREKNVKNPNAITCTTIIKTGKRKGEVCGCLCKTDVSKSLKMCLRHSKK